MPPSLLLVVAFVVASATTSTATAFASATSSATIHRNNNNNKGVDDRNRVLDFLDDFGAVADDSSAGACVRNSRVLQEALQRNASGNTLVFPRNRTFYLYPYVHASEVNDTILVLGGTLRFQRPPPEYEPPPSLGTLLSRTLQRRRRQLVDDETGPPPSAAATLREQWDDLPPCLFIDRSKNITLTSSSSNDDYENQQQRNSNRGVIDGQGSQWWGIPFIGYLEVAERRPRLLRFNLTEDLLIENVVLQDSPYHTLYLSGVDRVEIRNVSIVARRTRRDGHSFVDLSAFNTDGIDVAGHNVWVHDVDIWNQDDCITITDNRFGDHASTNLTFENVNASGLGFAIGSIGGSTVRNVTFKNSYLHRTVKGIYLKMHTPEEWWSRLFNITHAGIIENIRFENITMEAPSQWPIWIGPAQQADSKDPCKANPCSLCWPMTFGAQCRPVPTSRFKNITLMNIVINNPKMSTGVILASSSDNDDDSSSSQPATIENLWFHNVRVTKGSALPYSKRILETFPGLSQPINDKFVPHNNGDNSYYDSLDTSQSPIRGYIDVVPDDDAFDNAASTDDDDGTSELLGGRRLPAWAIALIVVGSVLVVVAAVCLGLYLKIRARRRRRRRRRRRSSNGDTARSRRRVRFQDLIEKEEDGGEAKEETDDSEENDHVAETENSLEQPLLVPTSPAGTASATDRNDNTEDDNGGGMRHLTACHFSLYHAAGLVVLSIALVVYYLYFHFPYGPAWRRTDRYYKCEGVTNGTASGNTWPVPYCFRTDKSVWWARVLSGTTGYAILGVIALACCLYAVQDVMFRYQDQAYETLLAFLEGVEEDDDEEDEDEEDDSQEDEEAQEEEDQPEATGWWFSFW